MQIFKVLVVEDEIIIRMFLIRLLSDLGCSVIGESSTGEEAVRIARESVPDIVFMDIKLAGEMNGVAAAKLIRNERNLPIVFSSAFEAKDLGSMDNVYFAPKPVSDGIIEYIINQIRSS